jgi:hypothetical protein
MWRVEETRVPEFIEFGTLRKAFIERTVIVTEKDALDRETRRMWTALRWCIQQYAGLCAGGEASRHGRHRRLKWDEPRKHILLGESNTMEAWTDGDTYIAFNIDVVKRLRAEPIKTAAYLFGLAEHEVAHQGDSIDCGHDEAFYQRYHEISISMAPERQRYLHIFMQKYTYSMEGEGQRDRSRVWYEQNLIERANKGREKRGLPAAIEDLSVHPFITATVQPEDPGLITFLNAALVEQGACPQPPDWDEVRRQASEAQERHAEAWRDDLRERKEEAEWEAKCIREEKARIAAILGVEVDAISDDAFHYFNYFAVTDEEVREVWERKPWTSTAVDDYPHDYFDDSYPSPEELEADLLRAEVEAEENNPMTQLKAEYHHLVQPGETWWSLERNAASAGFFRVEEYLQWRAGGAAA